MTYIRQKEDQLAKFYDSDAVLVHANTTLRKHYDDMLTSSQPLAVLPFHLQFEFIKEKSLADSKLKSQEMIGSKEGLTGQTANQNAVSSSSQPETANENSSMEVTSVLELTATKALNWLTSATLPPKKKTTSESQDLSESKSKAVSSPVTNQMSDQASLTNQSTVSDSQSGTEVKEVAKLTKANVEKHKTLTEVQRVIYSDARVSNVDCDNILSPADSMRSSQSGLQSLTQSMTNSATSLVNKLMQFGSSLSTRQTAYKKGVTEYSFDEDSTKKVSAKTTESQKKTPEEKPEVVEEEAKADIEEVKLKDVSCEPADRNSKRVSFDIVNLFDKLLLPGSKPEKKEVKPVSKIPRPTNRWSWSFGSSTKPAPTSPQKITKTPAKSDSEISKKDHYPKKAAQATDRLKGGKPGVKTERTRVVPPPKPPRQANSPTTDKKSRFGVETTTVAGRRKVVQDVNKNTATL